MAILGQCILTAIRHIVSLKKDYVLSTENFGGQVTVIFQFATILGHQGGFRHFEIELLSFIGEEIEPVLSKIILSLFFF